MPRVSEKRKLLRILKQTFIDDLLRLEIHGTGDGTSVYDKENDIIDDYILYTTIAEHIRYAVPFRVSSTVKYNNFMANVLPQLDEAGFEEIIGVDWKLFKVILDLIKEDIVFQGPKSCAQMPVEMQLMIVLYRLRTCSEGASIKTIASFFGVGDGGTIQNLTNRMFNAILRLKNKYMHWPSSEERSQIVINTFEELPNCIGYVGTREVPFAEKPCRNADVYMSAKHQYSLKMQLVCDHKTRIRHVHVGSHGSVSDAEIYNNSDLALKPKEYFDEDQWLAGGRAYTLTETLITPYGRNSNDELLVELHERNNFNCILSKYSNRIEHCFERLTDRFRSLRELKFQMRNAQSDQFASRWISVCAILNNLIMEQEEICDSLELIGDHVMEDKDNDENTTTITDLNNQSTVEGEIKRRCLSEFLNKSSE